MWYLFPTGGPTPTPPTPDFDAATPETTTDAATPEAPVLSDIGASSSSAPRRGRGNKFKT